MYLINLWPATYGLHNAYKPSSWQQIFVKLPCRICAGRERSLFHRSLEQLSSGPSARRTPVGPGPEFGKFGSRHGLVRCGCRRPCSASLTTAGTHCQTAVQFLISLGDGDRAGRRWDWWLLPGSGCRFLCFGVVQLLCLRIIRVGGENEN